MSTRRLIGILLAGATAVATVQYVRQGGASQRNRESTAAETAEAVARQYLAIEAREQQEDQTTWAPELEAERYEDEVTRFWDELNGSAHAWDTVAALPLAEVRIPDFEPPTPWPHGITRRTSSSSKPSSLNRDAWIRQVKEWAGAGWILKGTHWALVEHWGATSGSAVRSRVRVTARLENSRREERAMLSATLLVDWGHENPATPAISTVSVERAEILLRQGPPPFRLWLEAELAGAAGVFNDPLLVRDFNGDSRPDLLLVGAGEVWINGTADNSSAPAPFRRERAGGLPSERIQAAVVTDINSDGMDDLVLAGREGVRWIPGNGQLPWGSPKTGWLATEPLKHVQSLTAGDVDGDGDVDLWLTQYKLPYQQGQFPTPWYDARDGFPALLLLNDGKGQLTEATGSSGLDPVRNRRTYSASLVDLDRDGDLDLVNVSDFAGLDVLLNDGRGHFRDVTGLLGDSRHAFGMAHAINDINADGRPDLLMLGMGSTVAERLRQLGLERLTPGERPGTVAAMTFGNRLFLGTNPGGGPLAMGGAGESEGLRDTGWTWGAAWEDFDNDGRLDLAVSNGHETRASTSDYERQFWRHDRFVADSKPDAAAEFYFRTAAGRRLAQRASYGGWQDNQFRLQVPGGPFPDVAWLFGIAVPSDCRNLVASDLDLDGRLDLVVTTQEGWPAPRQRLLVYRNELQTSDWVGFQFEPGTPDGTWVELELPAGTPARWLVTGDSFRSQGPAAAHFGLGSQVPLKARIHRPGQGVLELDKPAVNQWHKIPAKGDLKRP